MKLELTTHRSPNYDSIMYHQTRLWRSCEHAKCVKIWFFRCLKKYVKQVLALWYCNGMMVNVCTSNVQKRKSYLRLYHISPDTFVMVVWPLQMYEKYGFPFFIVKNDTWNVVTIQKINYTVFEYSRILLVWILTIPIVTFKCQTQVCRASI